MRIEAAEVRRVDLELVVPIRTSYGVHRVRPIVLVRLRTSLGDAVGECSALAEPDYSAEYADGAEAVLAKHLLPRLLTAGGWLADESEGNAGLLPLTKAALAKISGVKGHPMAAAAVEMAVADLECRTARCSLAEALGATRTSIPAGASVGLGSSEEMLLDVAAAVEAGYRRVKVKVAPGAEAAVARVRQELPGVDLAVDANGSYEPARDAMLLAELDGLGLSVIEQPLAADDLAGLAELRRSLRTMVVLDEAIADPPRLAAALLAGAAGGVSIKPPRCGGVLGAAAAIELCRRHAVPCLVGGMLESGLGRAASIAVAALEGVTLPGDLGASDRYFAEDLTAPHVLGGAGDLEVPQGPGLGVTLLEAAPGRLVSELRPG